MGYYKTLKSGLTFGLSTLVKLAAGLVIIKLIARKLGADGLGHLGQMMSLMGIISLLAGGGIFTGIVKYVSEFRENERKLKEYLHAGSTILMATSILFGLFLLITASHLSRYILDSPAYKDVIYGLIVVQIFIGINNFAISVINGHQDVNGYAGVSIFGSLASVLVMYLLISTFQLKGAMFGIMLAPALMSLISVPYGIYRKFLPRGILRPRFDKKKTIKLLSYSGMLCATAITLPTAQIIVRRFIEMRYGWTSVGYWQGLIRISDAYLQFITVVLANYYLPELASARGIEEIRRRVSAAAHVAIPVTLGMALCLYLFRDMVLRILFPPSFSPMRNLFLFQAIGDCLKICAQTLGFITVAKAMTGIYVGLEVMQSVLFVLLSWMFLHWAGPIGVTYAYALTFFIQLIVVLWLYKQYIDPVSRFYNYNA
jgi:O-antigen/teichoic acid export membrane protein